jgi:hypothetical protein
MLKVAARSSCLPPSSRSRVQVEPERGANPFAPWLVRKAPVSDLPVDHLRNDRELPEGLEIEHCAAVQAAAFFQRTTWGQACPTTTMKNRQGRYATPLRQPLEDRI